MGFEQERLDIQMDESVERGVISLRRHCRAPIVSTEQCSIIWFCSCDAMACMRLGSSPPKPWTCSHSLPGHALLQRMVSWARE